MLGIKYNNLVNIVWYQALWFTAILGQERYEWLLALLLILHLLLVPQWRDDLKVIVTCGGIGILTDSLLAKFGLYIFDPNPAPLPIPFWLMSIWLGFAGTFLHSFTFFMTRPIIGTFVIGIAAPFSYLAGVRFEAVSFGPETILAMAIIGAAWLIMMPIFMQISSLFRTQLNPKKLIK
ncbi:DUF2878 domain-containing protein [Kordiimonas aquimaris]|uniref:DUF2878 domain-containing protein n=1 Tax=Kordiimonas aquimaris TaxID=707591 RepID=UPI0021D27AA7|nr:DUF2878 domain-containing protein [Kordiimonas aquimaris]